MKKNLIKFYKKLIPLRYTNPMKSNILNLITHTFKIPFRILTGIALILSALAITLISRHVANSTSSLLMVSFLDIGQGDALYIRAPNGNDVLIDGGPDDNVLRKIREVTSVADNHVSLIIATHPDKDHIAGLIPIFENFSVDYYVHTEIASKTSFDESLMDQVAQEPQLISVLARSGQRIILDQSAGVYIDILFPDQDTSHFSDTNEASIIIQLTYDQQKFLLTGDAPSSVEYSLIERYEKILPSNVLKLGHHGSKTSSSEFFLKAVQPTFAIVSAGKNNRYNHPSPEVLERVENVIPDSQVFSTAVLGTITFETDGQTIWKK